MNQTERERPSRIDRATDPSVGSRRRRLRAEADQAASQATKWHQELPGRRVIRAR
jgi:hypothetical protein